MCLLIKIGRILVLHRPPRRTKRRASSAAPLTTSRTMRSTTSKLIFVAVAFAAVFARGADAAADAACDTALSTAYNKATGSDCVESGSTCPSSCKTALDAAETACKDKEWTYDGDNSVKKWNDDAFTWYLYKVNAGRSALDKQDACDSVVHDFLIASVKTCVQGFTLAATTSTDLDQLFYCTGGGGTDASTCNDKCQAYIDIMDTTCDVGASYNAADADAKYDDQGIVMKVIEGDGPKGCKYVSTKVSPAGALRASLAVVSAVAAAVLAVA